MGIKPVLLTTTLSSAAGGLAASVPQLAHGVARITSEDVHVIGVEDPHVPQAVDKWGPAVHAHEAIGPRAFGYAPGIQETLARVAPDVIDVQGLWTYPSLANLRHHRRHGTSYVVTPRGMLDPWAREHSWWKKRAARFWFEDAHLAGAACLRATAEMEAEHFRSFGLKNPIAVVPNGVEIPEIRAERGRADRRRLLFLSRIHPKKGLPQLLNAWTEIAEERPSWELVIAGPDELNHTAEMQRLAKRLGAPRVAWEGPVYGGDKSSLYRSADLFVLPTYAENFGLVIAEALAHGVPVVTTYNAPWAGLKSNHCGWWIPLEDDRLRDTLLRATSLPRSTLDTMGARGRKWMERDFGWGGIAERMLAVYDAVVHGASLPQDIRFD